jgi:ankyrin repeat and BTB/POZ domain-containing protein 1
MQSFELHKFILSARTPYFGKKLFDDPETKTWKLPSTIPADSFRIVLQYLYLGDIPRDIVEPGSKFSEEEVLTGADKISKQLGIEKLWEAILSGNDRRLARQRYQDEVERAQSQMEIFFRNSVVKHRMIVDTSQVNDIKWPRENAMFADCLLRADEFDPYEEEEPQPEDGNEGGGIPIGPGAGKAVDRAPRRPKRAFVYPAHRAMLIRSPYFETMFSGEFVEAREEDTLRIINVDCVPEVLEIVLTFLYTEKADCPLESALHLLYTSDMLFLDKLKTKAAIAISTLGSGNSNVWTDRTRVDHENGLQGDIELINIYDVIHAAWDLRVQRLEEFAARYIAYRLEDYIDEEDFATLIKESANRLKSREETDTIELLDDIRYYLDERFRLRFEDAGLEEIMDDEGEINAAVAEMIAASSEAHVEVNGMVNEKAATELAADENGIQATVEFDGEGAVRTLDGKMAEDEFASDAINYQILLQKIDVMLDRLKLDA